ncbi:MAG: AMP-binding protein [Oscillospiraceae bacterium]|nr:AMP-binding protein [Oscillospiraceae bacterium]
MWYLNGIERFKTSETPAIVERTRVRTFRQLWEYSEKLAAELIKLPGKNPVVIYGDKNPDMVITMTAALKAGRAYVPVDVSYPLTRLMYISEKVEACAIFNFSSVEVEGDFRIFSEEETAAIFARDYEGEVSKDNWVDFEDTCYILFTSGSTGEPKGVQISKKNIMVYKTWFDKELRTASHGQHVVNPSPYSFDGSAPSLYCYLAEGKTLVCTDKELMTDVAKLLEWLRDNDVNMFFVTPAFIDMCRRHTMFNHENFPNIQQIALGGEVLTKQGAEFMLDTFPGVEVYNVYGPTEVTIDFTGVRITREMIADPDNELPIGRAIDGVEVFVDGGDGRRCGDREPGELCAIGDNVSIGYFKDPERTAKAFFVTEDGRRGYRTGDLAYRIGDLYYYCGRIDFQVKINGYRIELEDVANNLSKVSCVHQSAVIPAYKDGKVDHLVGFVVMREGADKGSALKNIIAIKKELAEYVPTYMVPRRIIILEKLPMNTNDKIDRKALAAMI